MIDSLPGLPQVPFSALQMEIKHTHTRVTRENVNLQDKKPVMASVAFGEQEKTSKRRTERNYFRELTKMII